VTWTIDRDGGEVVGRVVLDALSVVDERREDDDAEHKKEDKQRQLMGAGLERVNEDLETGRVARQLMCARLERVNEDLETGRVARQLMGAGLERVNEDLETGRVARQLEETHDADDAEELEKVVLSVKPRQQKVEIEGDGRHEVDDVDGRTKKAQDVRSYRQTHQQLEGKPGVARALDIEEGRELVGGTLIQQPEGATAV